MYASISASKSIFVTAFRTRLGPFLLRFCAIEPALGGETRCKEGCGLLAGGVDINNRSLQAEVGQSTDLGKVEALTAECVGAIPLVVAFLTGAIRSNSDFGFGCASPLEAGVGACGSRSRMISSLIARSARNGKVSQCTPPLVSERARTSIDNLRIILIPRPQRIGSPNETYNSHTQRKPFHIIQHHRLAQVHRSDRLLHQVLSHLVSEVTPSRSKPSPDIRQPPPARHPRAGC